MKVLILGAAGQLGRALWESRPEELDCLAYDRGDLDLAARDAIEPAIRKAGPDILLNVAAYTAVDRAETETDIARAVNAEAPAELARIAVRDAIRLVHISTDFVFPGDRGRPWRPEDPLAPLNRYGESKALGETRIRSLAPDRSLIVRTGWVYAPWGRNFFLTVLRLLGEREELRVIDDQIGTPTSALTLARFIWR
ncbi:dTDP-4-dehydrorhamnose reductase, partial [mine drainage metagenome]